MPSTVPQSLGNIQLHSASSSASGDVVGPASSTDNAIARFDGTTGKIIQNSSITIDDNGGVSSSTSTGTGVALTMSNSYAAGGIGESITIGNTQTQALTALSISTGTSAVNHVGIKINSTQTGLGSGLVVNEYASATQTETFQSIRAGGNANTNDSDNHQIVFLTNEENAGAGTNTGIYLNNKSLTATPDGSTATGAGVSITQNGVGGTALHLFGASNVNSSAAGLSNITLSNTQSAASVAHKIDLGSSARAHSAYLAAGSNASSTAVAFNADMATGWTGKLFRGAINAIEKFTIDKDGLGTFASTVSTGAAAGTTGAVKFNGTTSGIVSLSVADASGTWTMKLPTSAGTSGYFLQTDGSGNTSWAATSSFTWSEVTGTSQSMSVNNGYIANNASLVTLTLPTTAAVGDIVEVTGKGAGGWKIAQNASEIIHFSASDSTTGTGGSLASTQIRDSVKLICVVANNEWNVLSSIGNITIV